MQVTLVSSPDSSFTSLTQADITTLAGWGITGLVLYTDGNGQNFNFDVNTTYRFSGSPGTTMPASGQPYYKQWVFRNLAASCHAAGIKVYATILGVNNHQSSSNVGFYGPQLGSFNPAYTDPSPTNYTWTDWYQMMADLGDAVQWMNFDGVYLDNELDRVSGGTGESTWSAGYWANNFGASVTVAQERAWAQAAGASVMHSINNGRSGTNGNNYPFINYCSNSGGRLGNFPGGVFTQYYNHFGNTVPVRYRTPANVNVAADTAMETYSSYLWFMKGMASQTTGPVLFGDPAFYNYQWMTTSGLPWFSATSAAQCWTNAIAADVAGFANLVNGTTISGFTLSANCFVSPMIWPLDQSTVSGNGPTWQQGNWNSAFPAIWAGAQDNMYMMYQASGLTFGTALSANYASNSFVSPPSPATTGTPTSGAAANYTPLTPSTINPLHASGTGAGFTPTITAALVAAHAAGTGAGVNPTVSHTLFSPVTTLTINA